jgi:Na+-transporting NADH:ubiquinone oxidoreductase subunit A
MPKTINIKKGLNISMLGEAGLNISQVRVSNYAIKPTDFIGVFPRLLVKEGDTVKAGSPVFCDKKNEDVLFTSPVSGIVSEVKRGDKRVLEEIRIKADSINEYVDFIIADPEKLDRDTIIVKLLRSGIWPLIRQRPYSVIANPADQPKAIFISGFNSAPLAPDYNYITDGKDEFFQTGVNALKKLTEGLVYLNLPAGKPISTALEKCNGVEINLFSGPHPAGNIGIQINKLMPINKGDIIWYLYPQDVITIGKLFLLGKFDATITIALTGSEILNPHYYQVQRGSAIAPLLAGNIKQGNLRYISGNVLTGLKIRNDGYLGFYDDQFTVIPEGDYSEFFGWAAPGTDKFSFSNTFLSGLLPRKKYRLDTNLHGAERALVMTGKYEQVLPMDILPMQLIKAIIIEDIDLMEKLGIYEVAEEDFALVEFIDTSKTEIQALIRKGLDLMRKEMS